MTNAAQLAQYGSNNVGLSFKNRIINGDMSISQRTAINTNVAVATSSQGTFGPDRFWGYTGTGSLWNISQVSTSALDFPRALRVQRIAGQTSTSDIYCGQTIETANCTDLAGQIVTLSFYATAGANYSGGAATAQVLTGTAADQGTSSLNTGAWTGIAVPINTTFTPTTTRTRFTFTGTMGSTVQEIAFRFNWAGSGTAGANDFLDITGVQLEVGSVATSFDYLPYGTELMLCQRYYEVAATTGNYASVVCSCFNTSDAYCQIQFKVQKRASASVSISAFGNWSFYGNGSQRTINAIQTQNPSDTTFQVKVSSAGTFPGGNAAHLDFNPTITAANGGGWTAAAEL